MNDEQTEQEKLFHWIASQRAKLVVMRIDSASAADIKWEETLLAQADEMMNTHFPPKKEPEQ